MIRVNARIELDEREIRIGSLIASRLPIQHARCGVINHDPGRDLRVDCPGPCPACLSDDHMTSDNAAA